ncbi:MAG: tetraacyldisaccharide 4'-kinase, partial [Gammaproteobacteria bacterium]|nr:tetraacyldisaccharide 4'-kinase [Gammaproteobacteria bacterium]
LMTEKDAVKCRYFAGDNVWYVAAEVELSDEFIKRLDELLDLRAPAVTDAVRL